MEDAARARPAAAVLDAPTDPVRAAEAEFELASGSGRLELDPASLLLRLSPGAAALHGLPGGGSLGLATLLDRLHPADRPEASLAIAHALRGTAPLRLEYRLAGEALRWIEARGALAETPAGARLLVLVLDAAARRIADDEARLALREAEHRAKNALAAAQAVVRLTRGEDAREVARAVDQRLAVLGRAHARLSAAPPGAGVVLRPLLEEAFAPYGAPHGAEAPLLLHGPEVMLSALAVQPVSMALHELVTNAAKYGALSQRAGRVALRWRLRPGGGLSLTWQESGGPPLAAPPIRRGFGLTMIQSVIRGQLGGRLRVSWPSEGLRLGIGLPEACLLPARRG